MIAVIALVVVVHVALGGLLWTAAGPWKHWVIGAFLAGALVHVFLRMRKARRCRQSQFRRNS